MKYDVSCGFPCNNLLTPTTCLPPDLRLRKYNRHVIILVSNNMSHSGEDAFLCEVCGRGFGTKEKLKAHLFEHDPDLVEERMRRAV